MLGVIEAQSKWRRSLMWVDRHTREDSGLCAKLKIARTRLLSLQWNEKTVIPGAGTNSTAQESLRVLSDDWVNDVLIDMMFSHLSERAEQNEALDSIIIVETLRFMRDINRATSESDHTQPLTP